MHRPLTQQGLDRPFAGHDHVRFRINEINHNADYAHK